MTEKMKQIQHFVREILNSLGAREIHPAPTASVELMDAARIDEDSWERDFPQLPNQGGEGTVSMRTILMPSMLVALGGNRIAGLEAARNYEMGETYTKNYVIPGAAPFKSWNLSLGLYGKDEDLHSLKAMTIEFLEKMGMEDLEFAPESEYGIYESEACFRIVTRDPLGQEVELGIMGKIHPEVVENFFIGGPAYGAELFLDLIVELVASANRVLEPGGGQSSASIEAAILSEEAAQLDELERQINAMFGAIAPDKDLN